jgi:hypothetical protein
MQQYTNTTKSSIYSNSMGNKSSALPPQQPSGLRYRLPRAPPPSDLSFPCPHCHSPCSDGNIPQKVHCACDRYLLREDSGTISVHPRTAVTSFADLFTIRTQSLPTNLPELQSVTLGIFLDSVPRRWKRDGEIAWERLVNEAILPYVALRPRCLGLNDLVVMGGVRLKVMACEPACGIVGVQTSIQCYQSLAIEELKKVQIAVLAPNHLTAREFESIILPYFRANKHQHLHQGTYHLDQYIYLRELPFVVLAAEPIDGLLSPSTQLFYEPRGLTPASSLQLAIQVPPQWQGSFFTDYMLRPHFEGWHRGVYQGKEWEVAGLRCQVVNYARLGYVTAETRLQTVEPTIERMVLRMMGPDGRMVVIEDPRLQLLQQLLYLSQVMESSGLRGAADRTGVDVASSLPTRNITALLPNQEDNKCTICMSEYELQEEVTTLPCCNSHVVHFFHTPCIQEWLSRSQLCPMCKLNIQDSISQ